MPSHFDAIPNLLSQWIEEDPYLGRVIALINNHPLTKIERIFIKKIIFSFKQENRGNLVGFSETLISNINKRDTKNNFPKRDSLIISSDCEYIEVIIEEKQLEKFLKTASPKKYQRKERLNRVSVNGFINRLSAKSKENSRYDKVVLNRVNSLVYYRCKSKNDKFLSKQLYETRRLLREANLSKNKSYHILTLDIQRFKKEKILKEKVSCLDFIYNLDKTNAYTKLLNERNSKATWGVSNKITIRRKDILEGKSCVINL